MARATKHPPCRLYVLLARSAPVAVIFRRGPAKWVQLVKWSTDTDNFEEGQWFNGRIYERRCDLSPDGTKLVYFAQKINTRTMSSSYTDAWTAVSKPPFVTALALWPKGDCWNGGGLFKDGRHLLLNHPVEEAAAHPDHKPPKGLRVSAGTFARGEDDPIWSVRMLRDGWKPAQTGRYRSEGRGWRTEKPEVWERASPGRRVVLVQSLDAIDFRAQGGPYVTSFRLERPSCVDLEIEGARWADWDQSGRLVFAKAGRLFEGTVAGDELGTHLLLDLNANKPRAVKAPDWARRW